MKLIAQLGALMLCCLALSTAASAQSLYKSVSPDGKITYSNKPPSEAQVVKKFEFADQPSSALPDTLSKLIGNLRQSGGASPAAAASGETVLYAASWCGYCKKAKAYLAEKNIPYKEIDVDSEEGQIAFAQASTGTGIPLILVGDQRVQGFSLEAYDQLFATP